MERKRIRCAVLGVTLSLVALPLAGLAGEPETKESAPAEAKKAEEAPPAAPEKAEPAAAKPAAAEKPAGLVGKVVAAVPQSRTLVVDVNLGKKGILRVGAIVTERTKITVGGSAASFDALKEGARVRINIKRVENGSEATSVEIL